MSEPSLSHLSLTDLIAAIGSDRVTPGAGSAAALAVALGAACASKAISVTLKHRAGEPRLVAARECCAEIWSQALKDADQDSEAFGRFIRARSALAAERLIDAGEHLGRLIDALALIIEELGPLIEPNMKGDLVAARALAAAARTIQASNEAEAKAQQRRLDPRAPDR